MFVDICLVLNMNYLRKEISHEHWSKNNDKSNSICAMVSGWLHFSQIKLIIGDYDLKGNESLEQAT